jgi:hypothetical protein
MKSENIKQFLSELRHCPSKWELDNITWADRTTDPQVLSKFLLRIEELQQDSTIAAKQELTFLLELLEDISEEDCTALVSQTDDAAKTLFVENLARISAIEILTENKLSFNTMTISCKLSPSDFILCAKRAQDLINAVQGMVIKSEDLSSDVAQA